jgi:hypothetical protein
MSNPNTPETPKTPESPSRRNGSKPVEAPKAVGFGEFAEVYRARWEANHPAMIKRWQDVVAPGTPPSPTTDAGDTSSASEQGPSIPLAPENE